MDEMSAPVRNEWKKVEWLHGKDDMSIIKPSIVGVFYGAPHRQFGAFCGFQVVTTTIDDGYFDIGMYFHQIV